MISFLPIPKFAQKWIINMEHIPSQWQAPIKHACIWALASEKKLRDYYFVIDVQGVSMPYMQKIITKNVNQIKDVAENNAPQIENQEYFVFPKDIDLILSKKLSSSYKKDMLSLGRIVICQSLIYQNAKAAKIDLFEYLIDTMIRSTLVLLNSSNQYAEYRKILSKFSLLPRKD